MVVSIFSQLCQYVQYKSKLIKLWIITTIFVFMISSWKKFRLIWVYTQVCTVTFALLSLMLYNDNKWKSWAEEGWKIALFYAKFNALFELSSLRNLVMHSQRNMSWKYEITQGQAGRNSSLACLNYPLYYNWEIVRKNALISHDLCVRKATLTGFSAKIKLLTYIKAFLHIYVSTLPK